MARYVGTPKTREDRARVAWNLMNEDNKNEKAYRYVHSVQNWYDEAAISTLCLVYNATGDTLSYITDHDWSGNIGRTPYPIEIGNGQWAAFHHIHPSYSDRGSAAAVVYRAKNNYGGDQDCVLAWNTPLIWPKNKAYCDVMSAGWFDDPYDIVKWAFFSFRVSKWVPIFRSMNDSNYYSTSKWNGIEIEATTSSGYNPVFCAKIKIPYSP